MRIAATALGIADITALKSIHIIDGKADLRRRAYGHARTQAGPLDHRHRRRWVMILRGKRADNGDEMTCEWTTAMAERAGLLGKANWRKYTESMLWAHAASQLCRMLFADCFAGNTYTPEELGDDSSDERAVSHAEEDADGGSDGQAPGMGARTPEPPSGSDRGTERGRVRRDRANPSAQSASPVD